MNIDWNRALEVVLILLAALTATAARMLFQLIEAKDYPPRDPELRALWTQRYRWAVAGEVSAVILFVMIAEAIVIVRGYSGPVGVMIGATAAVLGYPFIAGVVRKRVGKKLEAEA